MPDDQKPEESPEARMFRQRCEAGARHWQHVVDNAHLIPTTRSQEEQAIINMVESQEGRKLSAVEAEWCLEQARMIGEV